MKAVKVQYKTTQEFAEANKANISKVMAELREINIAGIKYSVFISDDGLSFMHFAMFRNDDDQKKLNELGSFKQFAAELKASGPVEPPKPETVNLVNSSYDIF
ncbi:MAG: hypothetical protein JNK43_01660 [Ignavibacteria bacterium]|nr:hypothetical protein [Ignavibacteria bacterium]